MHMHTVHTRQVVEHVNFQPETESVECLKNRKSSALLAFSTARYLWNGLFLSEFTYFYFLDFMGEKKRLAHPHVRHVHLHERRKVSGTTRRRFRWLDIADQIRSEEGQRNLRVPGQLFFHFFFSLPSSVNFYLMLSFQPPQVIHFLSLFYFPDHLFFFYSTQHCFILVTPVLYCCCCLPLTCDSSRRYNFDFISCFFLKGRTYFPLWSKSCWWLETYHLKFTTKFRNTWSVQLL